MTQRIQFMTIHDYGMYIYHVFLLSVHVYSLNTNIIQVMDTLSRKQLQQKYHIM